MDDSRAQRKQLELHRVLEERAANGTLPEATPVPEVAAGAEAIPRAWPERLKAEVRELSFWYGETQVLRQITLPVAERRVTALIGASGCGKSTLLRCFNRMHDLYPGNRYAGEILFHPERDNIVGGRVNPLMLRLRVGMVFQRPNPFPRSIYENVAYGLAVRGIRRRGLIAEVVEQALRRVGLWEEVKDRLHHSALDLSGGQQQRLCIARALAPGPEIVLLDEPASALDPVATARIEELLHELKASLTVFIVTHNMQQAARVADYTAFMHLGELIEFNDTYTLFTRPAHERTLRYITGHFG